MPKAQSQKPKTLFKVQKRDHPPLFPFRIAEQGFKNLDNGTGAYQNILPDSDQRKDLLPGSFDDVQHRTFLEGQPRTGIVDTG